MSDIIEPVAWKIFLNRVDVGAVRNSGESGVPEPELERGVHAEGESGHKVRCNDDDIEFSGIEGAGSLLPVFLHL